MYRERFAAVCVGDSRAARDDQAALTSFSGKLGGLRWEAIVEFCRQVACLLHSSSVTLDSVTCLLLVRIAVLEALPLEGLLKAHWNKQTFLAGSKERAEDREAHKPWFRSVAGEAWLLESEAFVLWMSATPRCHSLHIKVIYLIC